MISSFHWNNNSHLRDNVVSTRLKNLCDTSNKSWFWTPSYWITFKVQVVQKSIFKMSQSWTILYPLFYSGFCFRWFSWMGQWIRLACIKLITFFLSVICSTCKKRKINVFYSSTHIKTPPINMYEIYPLPPVYILLLILFLILSFFFNSLPE